MTQQKSENCIVPKASGNRGKTWLDNKVKGGKAVPVKEKVRPQTLLFATAENPRKRGAEVRGDMDRSTSRLKKARKAKRKPLSVGPARMEEIVKWLEIAFENVAANQGAPGPDRQSIEYVQKHTSYWRSCERACWMGATVPETSGVCGYRRRVADSGDWGFRT